jgi:pyridoxamine 5'-phosphate oxidase
VSEPYDPDRVAELRRSYARGALLEGDLAADPFAQFATWLADAVAAGLPEPNAMVLATASAAGEPSARTVLLKGFDADGFVFFTNHGSRKARDLAANAQAALCFPWFWMERQVVVIGDVSRLDQAASAAYFRTRPRESQLGAWASEQSAVIAGRGVLEQKHDEAAARWPEGEDVPMPDFWGGYRLAPETVEFWQGRPGRLHDRLRYRRTAEARGGGGGDAWVVERLAP